MFTKWMYDGANFQVSFSEGPAPWVKSITIFDDTRFETEKGLKIGMSTFDAVRMYGDDLLIICVGEKVYLTVGKHRGTYQINMITIGIDEHCHV